MTKIIDFIEEAAKRGNNLPLELLIKEAEDKAIRDVGEWQRSSPDLWGMNTVVTSDPMKEMSEIHRMAGFVNRRQYFYQLSNMYRIDVDQIQEWGLELGTENDFTLLIERIHDNWDPGFD